jgi:hypothetical protein
MGSSISSPSSFTSHAYGSNDPRRFIDSFQYIPLFFVLGAGYSFEEIALAPAAATKNPGGPLAIDSHPSFSWVDQAQAQANSHPYTALFALLRPSTPFSGHFVQHASLGRIYRRFVLAEPTERPPLSLNVVRPSLPVADPTDLPDESLN